MEIVKKFKFTWFLAFLLCLTALFPAAAAKTGTLTLFVEDEPGLRICLYPVADSKGRLNSAFSAAGLTPKQLLDSRLSDENAALLARYVAEYQPAAQIQTTDRRCYTVYSSLLEGCYLVLTPEKNAPFDPFLVYMPTVINGDALYDITAEPKSDHPPTPPEIPDEPYPPAYPTEPTQPEAPTPPTEPSTTPDPDQPEDPSEPGFPGDPTAEQPSEAGPGIPQTGVNVLPKYLLLGLGAVCIVAGCVELLRGRKESHE